MAKLTEDDILSAIAELKESDDSKVKVSELAKKLRVARKTLYNDDYKHLLEYTKPGVAINHDNNKLLAEIMRTKSLLKKTQNDFEQLKKALEKERKEMERNVLTDQFFSDATALEVEQIRQESEGKTAQLNTKVNKIKELEISLTLRESKIHNLEESIRTRGSGANNVKFTFFKPDLLLANDAYKTDSKLSAWFNKYNDACIAKALEIINAKFERVVLHVSNFNCKTEDICKHVNYPVGSYAVMHIALFNNESRKTIIDKFTKAKIQIFCIHTKSKSDIKRTNAVARMFCLAEKIPVEASLIGQIEEQFVAPSLDDGYVDIYTKVIK